ncbi:MAG: response regulator transcription factor [Pseudomonadales bacterium]|nr:response regulator transcription factor [Pseudomonadales bacterium]
MRVIIADDHEVVRFGVRALLESLGGYEVVAEIGELDQLKELVHNLSPDLLILDYQMPGGHSAALSNYLKKRYPNLKILVFTGQQSAAILREIYLSQVDGILLKQDKSKEMLVALENITQNKRYVSSHVLSVSQEIDIELTAREMQILQLILDGLPRSTIADQLDVSVETIKTHRRNLMRKLDVQNVTQLVTKASQLRLKAH